MFTSDRGELMKCTCVRCGKEFEAIHKTSICEDCKIQKCIVCGSEFELKWPYTAETCSSKCRGEYRKISGKGKLAAQKASNTLKARSGVSNPGAISLKPKKCAYCGKMFTPTSNRQKYCKDKHYGSCPVCGKLVEIKDMSIGPQACSEECRQKRIQKTCEDRYGSKCAVNSDYAKSKSKETCLKKYGVDHYSKTSEYKQRFQTTMLDRYGNSIPLRVESIKDKQLLTNQQRYGGNSPMCSDSIKDKSRNTIMENYGGFGMASPEIRSSIESTNLQRYGVKHPAQNEQIKSKMQETCRKLYGSSNWLSCEDRLINSIKDSSKFSEYLKFSNDPESYILAHYDHIPTCIELCRDTGVTDTTVYSILLKNGCRHLATFHRSSMEVEIYEFLLKFLDPAEIVCNCRSEITPLELDFYIPKYKFAIECDPTVTHNSSFPDPWGTSKPPSYHKNKTDLCEKNNIFLFHVFGYEWSSKKDIIKSMIQNVLSRNSIKIYARKCKVDIVCDSDCRRFLNQNHRQGYAASKINLGLYYDEKLVSLMTFGPARSTLGRLASDNDVWELIRFCNIKDTTVVGGASKLFKYFTQNFHFSKIVSFSDRAHTRGRLYEFLGFYKIYRYSYPSYVWVSVLDDSYYSRVTCQKRNLIKLFNDDTIDVENKTERQIMEEHGYARVYDSGVIRWEYIAK